MTIYNRGARDIRLPDKTVITAGASATVKDDIGKKLLLDYPQDIATIPAAGRQNDQSKVAALQKQVDALTAENAALKSQLQAIQQDAAPQKDGGQPVKGS